MKKSSIDNIDDLAQYFIKKSQQSISGRYEWEVILEEAMFDAYWLGEKNGARNERRKEFVKD